MIAAALAPLWFVAPLAAIALASVVWHLHALREADIPESRKRIRSATGGVMLIAIPMIAWTFGAVPVDDPKTFVIAWTGVTGLLTLIVILACIDVVNTARIARRHNRSLARERRRLEHVLSLCATHQRTSGSEDDNRHFDAH